VKAPGIVINPRARRVAREPGLVREIARRVPAEYVHVTYDADGLDAALSELARRQIDTLVVVGGDGTAGTTLTRLVALWPEGELPRVLLSGGGTVNTIAKSLGARGGPLRTIDRLLAHEDAMRESLRPLVRVQADGCAEPRYGMIFANGLATRFLELYYEETPRGVRGAVEVVGRTVGSALVHGPLARHMFEPMHAQIRVDGEPLAEEYATVLGAANVRDVGLGFRPFLTAGRDPDRIHFVTTEASGLRLAAELPALRAGLHGPHSCLHHRCARRIEIELDRPERWTLDADFFPATQRLVVSAGPRVRFLVPA
jgi:diacylglycerol kinase family enzyme